MEIRIPSTLSFYEICGDFCYFFHKYPSIGWCFYFFHFLLCSINVHQIRWKMICKRMKSKEVRSGTYLKTNQFHCCIFVCLLCVSVCMPFSIRFRGDFVEFLSFSLWNVWPLLRHFLEHDPDVMVAFFPSFVCINLPILNRHLPLMLTIKINVINGPTF